MAPSRNTVIGALAATALAAGAIYYLTRKDEKPDVSRKESSTVRATPSTPAAVSVSSSTTSAPSQSAPASTFDEAAFANDIRQSINSIVTANNTTSKNEKKIIETLKTVDTDSLKPSTVFLIAHWMHVLYTARTSQTSKDSKSGEERIEVLKKNRGYIETAWQLVNMDEAAVKQLEDSQRQMLDALQLDIACRLKDVDKMNKSLDRMILPAKESKDLQLEELVSAFCTAPLLGRWDNMVMLGDALSKKQNQVLDMFHAGAMQDMNMLDYAVLYKLAKEQTSSGAGPNPPHFEWMTYEVSEFRIRFRSADAKDPAHLEELKKQLPADVWQPVPTHKGFHLLRLGALVHWVNPGALPLPLSGIALDNHWTLSGYLEMAEDNGKVRHSETFDLKADPSRTGFWIGTDTIKQEKVEGNLPGVDEHTIVFDIELKVEKDEEATWKVL